MLPKMVQERQDGLGLGELGDGWAFLKAFLSHCQLSQVGKTRVIE